MDGWMYHVCRCQRALDFGSDVGLVKIKNENHAKASTFILVSYAS